MTRTVVAVTYGQYALRQHRLNNKATPNDLTDHIGTAGLEFEHMRDIEKQTNHSHKHNSHLGQFTVNT